VKFSEFDGQRWGELEPYFDTCILPVTGLSGSETPAEATERLETLRDLLELVELPFKGRTVTYPAMHYVGGSSAPWLIEETVARMKKAGFRYVIVASLAADFKGDDSSADLWLTPMQEGALPAAADVSATVQAMWRRHAENG